MAKKKEPHVGPIDFRFWKDHSPVVRKIFLAQLLPEEAVSVVAAADLLFQWSSQLDTHHRLYSHDDRPAYRHARAVIDDLEVCQSYLLHIFEEYCLEDAHFLVCCGDIADQIGQLIEILNDRVGPEPGDPYSFH